MKKHLLLLCIVISILSISSNAQNLLNGPECVSYDSLNNRYLVSNYNDGNIVAIDSAGYQSYFKQRSGHALGNCIEGNAFYTSIGNTILGLSLDNPNDTIMYLPITGTTQMDGMTTDDDNNLYVLASIQAKIYKINLLTQRYSLFVGAGISSRPQDIIFDRKNNRLLVCSWYNNSPIQAVDLNDSTVSTIVVTTTGNCDGLAMVENGNYYFSTWLNNSVYYYDSTFTNPPILFSSGHNGPSNICFNKRANMIAVPNFNSNTVDFILINPVSVEEETIQPKKFNLYQNYPNPFNPLTKISWQSPASGFQSLKVYNLLGNEIAVLVNEYRPAGEYETEFNASNLPSGVYFYQLKSGKYSKTLKMLYLK